MNNVNITPESTGGVSTGTAAEEQRSAQHRDDDSNPLISVIIPTYYRNDLLEEAIESVLTQEYDPVEIIVVDDSGEGHAAPVLDRYEDDVTGIIREENGGDMVARTTGFEASSGQYVHFLDDDDLFLEGKLSKSAAVLMDNSDVGCAYTGVRYTDGNSDWKVAPSPELSDNMLERALRFESTPCYTGSMLMRRQLLDEIFPPPQLPAANDSNLKIELAQRTAFGHVDEYLVQCRRMESEIWQGLGKIHGMRSVLETQADVYERYPEVERDLRTRVNFQEGMIRLDNQLWSPKATLCFARATSLATDDYLKYGGATVASLFGRPAFDGAGKLKSLLARGAG
jgi:glycosyltransferase involved in cell wall biosynthesis